MVVIRSEKLRKEFGTFTAVNDVDLSVEAGSIVGLIGPNGAGKTTLLRMLATLSRPTRGTINVLGYDSNTQYHEIRGKVAFLPDFFNLYKELTLKQCLTFFAKAYRVPADQIELVVNNALTKVDLTAKSDNFCRHLSRGMVQRLGMAALLVRQPEIYLLDEPASGLDPVARIQLKELLRQVADKGSTVIISSHILTELADFCSDIIIMDKGKIALSGSVPDISRQMAGSARVNISVLGDVQQACELLKREMPDNDFIAAGQNITFESENDNARIAAVNSLLVRNGIEIYSIEKQVMNLEEIFMRISGHEIIK